MEKIKNIIINILYQYIDTSKVQNRISHLIMMLYNTTEVNQIEELFLELEAIHFVLSKYLFDYKIILNDSLHEFIRIFERIDDARNRQFLLTEIKSGKWNYL